MYDLNNLKTNIENLGVFPVNNIDFVNDSIELILTKLSNIANSSKSTYDSESVSRAQEFNVLVTQLQTIANSLEQSLSNEVTRATGAENTNALAITAESNARTAAIETINTAIASLQSSQSNISTEITDRLDVIQGNSETVGSINYAIAQLVGGAPEIMDTLSELKTAFESADGSILQTITDQLTALKGNATETADSLGELEGIINTNKTSTDNAISAVSDSVAVVQSDVDAKDQATNGRIDVLTTTVDNNKTDLNNKIDTIDTRISGSVSALQLEVSNKDANMKTYVDTKVSENASTITINSNEIATLKTTVGLHSETLNTLGQSISDTASTLRDEFAQADQALRTVLDGDIGQVSDILTKVKLMIDDETDGNVISVVESLQGIVGEINNRETAIKGTAIIQNGELIVTHNIGTNHELTKNDWEVTVSLNAFAPALLYTEKVDANSFKVKATDLRYFASAAKPMNDPVSITWIITFKPKKYTSTITKTGLNETATLGSTQS